MKAFQRLIQRWRNAHPGEAPSAQTLRDLLAHNFVGIDRNGQAVRTAAFSLYLALCDEIDPKRYWTDVRFPRLRDKRLLARDFFDVDRNDLFNEDNVGSFDLVTGNAPWGKNTLTPPATLWAKQHDWPTPYGQIGPLFLPKAAHLTKSGGQVTMLQPATLLFGRSEEFVRFRERLFSDFQVEEVVNLSALRFGLFRKAISPACILSLSPGQGTTEPIQYVCPKPDKTVADNYRIAVEAMDVHLVLPEEATADPLVWNVLRWGSRRDLSFIRKLRTFPSVARMVDAGTVKTRDGVIRGDRKKVDKSILNRLILNTGQFPEGTFLELDASALPRNTDPHVDARASTDFSAFEPPQLIIKKSWQAEAARFRAAIVRGSEGILCSHSYVSIRGPQSVLDTVCLTYNSLLPIYYLFLTSSRLGTYRPEVLTKELLQVPLPDATKRALTSIRDFEELEKVVEDSFSFQPSERMLIEDRIRYTLADFTGGPDSPGRQSTPRGTADDDVLLFCNVFLQVLHTALGPSRPISGTVFIESDANGALPVRMTRFRFGADGGPKVRVEVSPSVLQEQLAELTACTAKETTSTMLFRRVFRIYTEEDLDGRSMPAVYLIRPDEVRYWTRAEALREADEVVADFLTWNGGKRRVVNDLSRVGLPA